MIFLTRNDNIEDVCVLYFYTNWLDSNKRMIDNLLKLEKEFSVPVFAIDCDMFRDSYVKKYNIKVVPTIILNKNNLLKIEGYQLIKPLRVKFREIYNNTKGT